MPLRLARTVIVITWLIVMAGCDSNNSSSSDVSPVYSTSAATSQLNDRYVELFTKIPSVTVSDQNTISDLVERRRPEFAQVLSDYYELTTAKWRRRGEIVIAVVDDNGDVVSDVAVTGRGVSAPARNSREPIVDESEYISCGIIKTPWPTSLFAVELEFHKKGYRTARVCFEDIPLRHKGKIYYESLVDLSHGLKLPPSSSNGPVRVLMRRELAWAPPVKDGGSLSIGPRVNLTPKAPPIGAEVLANSDNPNVIRVKITGTYVVVSSDGCVVYCFRAFTGQAVGFADVDRESLIGKYVDFVHSGILGPMGWKASNGPYKLYLYSEAKSLPPDE